SIADQPVLLFHVFKNTNKLFGQYRAMCFQDIIYSQGKVHQRTVIISAPLRTEKVVKIKVCNDQCVPSKLGFKEFLGRLDRRVGIRKIINLPMQVDAIRNFRLKPALYIPTHKVSDK